MSEQFVYGVHAVSALLDNPHRSTKTLFVSQDRVDTRIQDLLDKAIAVGIKIEKLNAQQMNQRFSEFTHQGVVASASALPDYNESHLLALLEASKNPSLILILVQFKYPKTD